MKKISEISDFQTRRITKDGKTKNYLTKYFSYKFSRRNKQIKHFFYSW